MISSKRGSFSDEEELLYPMVSFGVPNAKSSEEAREEAIESKGSSSSFPFVVVGTAAAELVLMVPVLVADAVLVVVVAISRNDAGGLLAESDRNWVTQRGSVAVNEAVRESPEPPRMAIGYRIPLSAPAPLRLMMILPFLVNMIVPAGLRRSRHIPILSPSENPQLCSIKWPFEKTLPDDSHFHTPFSSGIPSPGLQYSQATPTAKFFVACST